MDVLMDIAWHHKNLRYLGKVPQENMASYPKRQYTSNYSICSKLQRLAKKNRDVFIKTKTFTVLQKDVAILGSLQFIFKFFSYEFQISVVVYSNQK